MRGGSFRAVWLVRGLLVALGTAALGCAQDYPLNTLAPEAPIARTQADLFWLVLWIAIAIFVIVEGALLLALIRFRNRGDAQPMPRQVHGNTRLEVIWTIIPAVILAVLAVPTVRTIFALDRGPAGDALAVKVTGHQWWWEFEYPDEKVFTANDLHIPTGRPVRLTLLSTDVIHSFWPARLAGKQDVIPGRENHLYVVASKPGRYFGQCAEFCGASHANMRFRVVAQDPNEFDQWVREQQDPARTGQTGLAAEGARIFQQKACIGCHTIRGTQAQSRVGPELTHLMSRKDFAGSMFELNEDNLKVWLRDPPAAKPGSKMPDLDLTEGEIRALAAYLQTLS